MHLEIFVYLLCRFLGENRIYTVQRENSFANRALPRNWTFGLVMENCSCKDWHGDSFPQAGVHCQPGEIQTRAVGCGQVEERNQQGPPFEPASDELFAKRSQ